MLSNTDRRYFRLSVGKLKKDTPTEMSCNCVACDDTSNRLHLVYVGSGAYSYVKCFNAGCFLEEPTSMRKFLEIIGSVHLYAYKRETMQNTVASIKNERSLQDIINRATPAKIPEVTHHNEPELPLNTLFSKAKDSPQAVEYLANRNINVQDRWYYSDQKFFEYEGKKVFLENYIIIPIINANGKYRGFYSRSLDEKRFSTFLLPDTEKIWIQYPEKKPDIIAEGIFDAISSGFENPGAMLGAGLSQGYRENLSKDTIFAFDSDETGIEKALEYADYGFRIFVWPEMLEKDLNDLSNRLMPHEIKRLILDNTSQGMMAKVKLRMKEK